MEKNIPCKQKTKAEVVILISDKIDFKPKTITRDSDTSSRGYRNVFKFI